jgi:hypothetical protein
VQNTLMDHQKMTEDKTKRVWERKYVANNNMK